MSDDQHANYDVANDPAMSKFVLVVREPFETYVRGDRIDDADKVADVVGSEHAGRVNKVAI